ncbi:MAG TPA: hypothetical protein DCF68_13370 [Cyanothece sp. UBA12306]|nr:hypothetical protein [Cyanothece sp. UBA12306]
MVFWLLIPLLIQVIIDKVIVQNSPDTLSVLGLFLLISSLITSGVEIGLATLTTILIRSALVSEFFLRIANTLPKVLAIVVVMFVYYPLMAGASIILTALAGGTYYLLNRKDSSSQPLPLSFRLPLTLIFIFVVWYGSSLVLEGDLSLGQLIALSIFNIQFVSLVLSHLATTLARRIS